MLGKVRGTSRPQPKIKNPFPPDFPLLLFLSADLDLQNWKRKEWPPPVFFFFCFEGQVLLNPPNAWFSGHFLVHWIYPSRIVSYPEISIFVVPNLCNICAIFSQTNNLLTIHYVSVLHSLLCRLRGQNVNRWICSVAIAMQCSNTLHCIELQCIVLEQLWKKN